MWENVSYNGTGDVVGDVEFGKLHPMADALTRSAEKYIGIVDEPNGSCYLTKNGDWVGGIGIKGYDEDHRPQMDNAFTGAGIKLIRDPNDRFSMDTKGSPVNSSEQMIAGMKMAGMIRISARGDLGLDLYTPLTRMQRNTISDYIIEHGLTSDNIIIDTNNTGIKERNILRQIINESAKQKTKAKEEFQEQEHPRDGDGKFAKKGSSKSSKELKDNYGLSSISDRESLSVEDRNTANQLITKMIDLVRESSPDFDDYIVHDNLNDFDGVQKVLFNAEKHGIISKLIDDRSNPDPTKWKWIPPIFLQEKGNIDKPFDRKLKNLDSQNPSFETLAIENEIVITMMSPLEFLKLSAPQLARNPEKRNFDIRGTDRAIKVIDTLKKRMLEGKPVDTCYIKVDNTMNVWGHEGRHRALSAIQAGIELMPVYVMGRFSDENKEKIMSDPLKYLIPDKKADEAFVEQEHPRDRDGKFTSKSGSIIKSDKLIKAETIHNNIINNPENIKPDLIKIVNKEKYDIKTKRALNNIIYDWDNIQTKIAKDKGCIIEDGHYKTNFPMSKSKNKGAGRPDDYMESVCASSATQLKIIFDKYGLDSEVKKGGYWGKGKSYNVDAYPSQPTDDKNGSNIHKKLNDLGYDKLYTPIKHMWLELRDGTVIDGAYGQFLEGNVKNMYQRLSIVTPNDPRQDWYVDGYAPEDEDDWYLAGLESEFVEQEHPRDRDGKFTDKDGGVIGSKAKGKGKTKRKTKRKKTPKYKPIEHDSKYSWRDTSKPLTTANGFHYRSRMHDIKIHKSRGKKHPETVYISDKVNPEYIEWFTGFWNNNPSVRAMIKHIDKLTFKYSVNPKNGGRWVTDDKEVTIMDYPRQNLPFFKSTTVHEIVGHTFWDWARDWNRNELIEFNELANKMTPVNQYVKDNEEKWKSWNDETGNQIRALDKKYGIKKDEYGYKDVGEQLWGDELDEYQKAINKINDGKFIGNPSNKFMNRDSSSMTRYANEQHSAITEIMYGTLNDSPNPSAIKVLMGDKDLDRLKVLWKKLHPKFVKSTGKGYNLVNEALICDTVE